MTAYILLTAKELARKRVLLVALLLSALFIGFYTYGLMKVAEASQHTTASLVENYTQAVLLLTLGLYFAQMVTAFFVFFSSLGAISGEIDNGQLFAVLSRPIPRWKVYLGKWLGFAVWNVVYSAVMFWSIVLAVHFVLGFPLVASTVLKAFLLFEWIPLLLGAVALLGSSYLPMLGNAVFCALLYGMSLFAGLLEGVTNQQSTNHGIENFGIFTSLLLPSDAVFRRMVFELFGGADLPFTDSLSSMLGPFSPAALPSNAFLVYTALLLIGLLSWGCIHFTRRDIS